MGEIADMMLDGTLCEGCGEFMGDHDDLDSAPGYPRYCSPQCARDRGAAYEHVNQPRSPFHLSKVNSADRTMQCKDCAKKFASIESLTQHRRDKHKRGEATP